ncbi:MAG: DUF2817 domain-containing protein [Bacteriovoracaceae bacterium]|nr:DUF2817 domain-containing protein [Bacteriovoracaceae bacterium]
MSKIFKLLPELNVIEDLAKAQPEIIRHIKLTQIDCGMERFPIDALIYGPDDPTLPCVVLVGGVHGLERIGTQVIISYLKTITHSLNWDADLRESFKKTRLIAIPILNPAGTAYHWRCNPNGVDLMRNAPVEADPDDTTWLLSGHRISNALPWYRGKEQAPMEIETQTLVDFFKKEVMPSRANITMDFHSGFGTKDQIWYPWAKTRKEKFPFYDQFINLQRLFETSFPNHIYKIEPQTKNYVTHGDLWDYLLQEHRKEKRPGVFIPLTLEIGSWIWVKKNPLQLFSILGLFNPIKEHRIRRQLRRHVFMLDFLQRAVRNYDAWH